MTSPCNAAMHRKQQQQQQQQQQHWHQAELGAFAKHVQQRARHHQALHHEKQQRDW
jgi:nucleoside-specific outer membrane channel protein Tsx